MKLVSAQSIFDQKFQIKLNYFAYDGIMETDKENRNAEQQLVFVLHTLSLRKKFSQNNVSGFHAPQKAFLVKNLIHPSQGQDTNKKITSWKH